MSSNVVRLFPKKVVEEPAMVPRINGLERQIFDLTNWAENEGVDVYSADWIYFCADFMQQLQIKAHLAKRAAA